MSYLVSGLWHFAAATAFAVAFGVFWAHDPTFYLAQWPFDGAALLSSSALFFVPQRWAKKGALKFLHYPLPDWDVLLLGPASHRNWLTHSALLPLLLFGAAWRWPQLARVEAFLPVMVGCCVGVGSHLFWDCVGSQRHKIVIVPYWFSLREGASRLWLLCGAVTSLWIGWAFQWAFANAQKLGL